MCTQELIWCSCGHAEFLPIEKCPRVVHTSSITTAAGGGGGMGGGTTTTCWIVVHGNHHIEVPTTCSYCQHGLNHRRPLMPAPRPEGGIKSKVEKKDFGEMVVDDNYNDDGQENGKEKEHKRKIEESAVQKNVVATGEQGQTNNSNVEKDEGQHAEMDMLSEDVGAAASQWNWDDVMNTEFTGGFDLGDELWSYM